MNLIVNCERLLGGKWEGTSGSKAFWETPIFLKKSDGKNSV